ncbi:MAG TPA: ABC transporter ATP-binding protein [Phycisphaerae bacterium]|nr:ABC transporter ATP-binding protein [Phycisphaerae bacterium]
MEPIIRISALTKSFGSKEVLRGVDLEIAAGQILGYIGPNGAGKTTTVKILCGMLDGFGGRASVCGFDVAVQPLEVKRRIGYVPESAALYDALTPLEYLRFIGSLYGLAKAEVERRAAEMLELFELGDELDQRMSTFSKGMRQKVLITAGLIHNPDVIFMDEPLAGLDANSVVIVKEIITRLAGQGKTIFYCSHIMDVVERVCHRIAIIDEGKIIADGTFEELQAKSTAASLEKIFTQLTSAGGHAAVADRFIAALKRGTDSDD